MLLVNLISKAFDLEGGEGIGIILLVLVNQFTNKIELVVQLVFFCCFLESLLVGLHSSNLRALKVSALTPDWRGGTGAKDGLLCEVKSMESVVTKAFVVAKNEVVLAVKTLS